MLARAKRVIRRALGGGVKLGEIKDDELYRLIERTAARPDVRTILEIGSSTGDGSTEAFAKGMAKNPSNPKMFCIEALKDRFEILKNRYASNPNIHCYNVSSVAESDYPTEEFVTNFTRAAAAKLPDAQTLLGWRRSEIEYTREQALPTNGIARIKQEHGLATFDLVLLDGSEFIGAPELDAVYGSRIILMDDILAMKNYYTCARLMYDPRYRLTAADRTLRQGFAAFELR